MQLSSHAVARLLGDWSSAGRPAHRRLAEHLRLLILDGRLPLAVSMPGERDLAAVLEISRTTVSTAFSTLREQGYLSARARSRSVTRVPTSNVPVGPDTAVADAGVVNFSHAAPAAPREALYRAYRSALDQLPRHLPRHGYTTSGLPELRVAIARRYEQRGLPTSPDQILVTNGAQHALVLVARALLRPGDRVVLDHPTYPHAIQLFGAMGCRRVTVGFADRRWDNAALAAATRGATLAYLLPDFHNPTGLCLPDEQRASLRLHCQVVVDETMADLALDVAPPTPLAAYHPEVIAIGSAAKTFWGGLRIGWVRSTPEFVQRLAQSRPGTDLGTPVVEQLACAELVQQTETIAAGRQDELRTNRQLLLSLMDRHLPDWRVHPGAGGLSVWARLPLPVSSALAAAGPQFGVQLAAGPRFGVGGVFEDFMRLPYSLDAGTMTAGVTAIAEAFQAVLTGRPVPIAPARLSDAPLH